jgi:DNA-binding beta-propeller fold protein YncE
LEGASAWQMLRHVRWPQISAQVAAAWYVIYLLSLWDVETLVLIVPPGGETLALRIFNFLHYGHNSQVNALCVLLLGLALLPLLLWQAKQWLGKARLRAVGQSVGLSFSLLVLLLTGCSPKATDEPVLASKFFSTVQIIGSRGTGLGQFNKPRSVAVDTQDNLYVVDMTGRVQKFSPSGQFLLSWQMPQTDKGKPKGMCRDGGGNIVIIEPHYSRINHYSPKGKLVAQWGENGTNFGQVFFPRAVGVNSHGDLYVSEYGVTERVQRFSSGGTRCLGTFGWAGDAPGNFNRPEGLGIDAQDRVYVADSCNHRIQIFSSEGKFLHAYGHAGAAPGQLSYPYDVQVDEAGRQYVCEFGNSRVQIFDPEGRSLEILGGPGPNPGQFSNPWSIALDSAGNLYVADSLNHRVQKFIAHPRSKK